ncbi:MAG: YihY/virulence factor BrkB family protein [Planctomycetota bacterium]
MARLSDVPRVIKHVGPISFARRIAHQIGDDNLLTWAAAMAYSWLFALFPFLIFLLTLVPLLPGSVRGPIVDRVESFVEEQLPGPAGDTVRQTLLPLLGETAVTTSTADVIRLANGSQLLGDIVELEPQDWTATEDSQIPDSLRFRLEGVERTLRFEAEELSEVELGTESQVTVSAVPIEGLRGILSIGLLLTLFTASGGMNMTMSALDRCYDIKKPRPFWKQRLIAIALTVVVGTLVILVLVLLPISSLILQFLTGGLFANWFGIEIETAWWVSLLINVVRYTFGITLLVMILGLVYHFGPSLKRRFHLITPGAVFTIAMWLLTGLAMRTYVEGFGGTENYAKTYGAVGGIVILLLLFYVDALVLMIGAEINSEIDFALLGIPRKGDEHPEEVEAAKIPESDLDEEERELRQELKEAVEGTPDPEEPPGSTPPVEDTPGDPPSKS